MAALSALQTDLKLKLDDTNSRILSTAQQTQLLNEALEEWVKNTEEVWQENAYAVTAKQYLYTAPTDLLRVISARYGPTAYSELEIVNAREFEHKGGYDLNMGPGTPKMLVVDGVSTSRNFRVYPAPTATSATTAVSGAHSDSVTTISVDAVSGLRSPSGWVLIDSEKILYQNVNTSTNQLLLCKRAMGGTTAAAHSDDATVTQLDLFVTYSRRPAALSASTDVPEINGRWHKDLVYYALWNAYSLDGNTQRAEWARRVWEEKLRTGRIETSKERGAAPSIILRGPY